jgi:hypothetical protein
MKYPNGLPFGFRLFYMKYTTHLARGGFLPEISF